MKGFDEMNGTTIVLIVFVIIVFLTPLIRRFLQAKKQYEFSTLLQNKDFDLLEKKLNSFSSKALFPRYMLESVRLQIYLVQDQKKKIDQQYRMVIESATTKKQKKEILSNAFEHYVFLSDAPKSRNLLEKIKKLEDESLIQRCQMLYDIFIEKSTNYIKPLEDKFSQLEGSEKMISAYLLSIQYSHLNNKKKAEYYAELSKQFFE